VYQRVERFPSITATGNRSASQSLRDMLGTHWQMIKDWSNGKADK